FSASSRRGRGFLREDIMTVNHEDGTVGRVSDNRPNRGVLIAGVQIGWEDVRLSPATVIRNGKSVLRDEKWLEHTSLVLLAEREAGRFEKTLGKEKFEVEPEPDATAN
ncbi:MAG TPA: hypothetical protein VHN79_06390, partial [Lacunisphaera sp.]|nr:hypothetical protein [Lacunisphaera sp.]